MLKTFILIFVMICMVSCNTNDNKKTSCAYTLADINKIFDSSMMERVDYKKDSVKEVLDRGSNFGERGIYKFDENDILRVYAFLINDRREYDFSIHFDSLGNEIRRTGTEVVQWYFRKLKGDSLAVTFFLSTINRSYENLSIEYGGKRIENIQLRKSKTFSNLIGSTNDVKAPSTRKDTVYLYGIREDACSRQKRTFKDFVLVPKEVL
jgi:hypothetical protein